MMKPGIGNQMGLEVGKPVKTVEKVALVFEHTLSGVDERTIQDLTRLLNPTETQISLVHVMPDTLSDLPLTTDNAETLSRAMRETEQKQLESRAGLSGALQMRGFNVQVEQVCSLRDQNIQPLLDQIRETQQELVVLCGNHFSSVSKVRNDFFMNLTAHAPVSVLWLKKHLLADQRPVNVLFGVDDSEASLLAARKLGQLIQPREAAITLTMVQSPIYQQNAVLAPYVNQEVLDEALANNAKMVFEMIETVLEPQGIMVAGTQTLIGSPATELGYLADQETPDLVAVGSHNRHGFMAWVMGSVSSQLLHWSTHNLLVIR